MQTPVSAFTAKANGICNVLKTQCGVAQVVNSGSRGPVELKYSAIWDTGATASVISQSVVDACGLAPTGVCQVHGVSGITLTETYYVAIFLPNGVCFSPVRVTKGNLGGNCDVLIGMDIIGSGDFSVTNFDGKTAFSFRMPSQACVDYVQDHNDAALHRAIMPASVKPNSSSWRPSGSRKKKGKK
ncbi:aspartyl protease family protein [Burkholderia sp. SR8]|uniref:aspartyl protease family protein n=1 Tax=Burkholderia sp. SR8 TaxID=3062277 RepID=UPI0040634B77